MATSLPILCFHSIDDQSSPISFPPHVFRHGMARLHQHGYRTVTLLEAVECLRQGKPFPDRSLAITFDDGHKTVYDEAFPTLQQYDLSATIFLTVGEKAPVSASTRLPSLEGRPMLNWDEIRRMHRAGMAIGAHTLTHPDLTRIPTDQIEAEVYGSKAAIENTLGDPISCFAYPYGYVNRQSRDIVRRYFACACSGRLGLMTARSDAYALERVETYYFRSEKLFDLMLSRLLTCYLWTRRIPRQIRLAIQRHQPMDRPCHLE